jgi:hypothetical protein
MSPIAPRYPAVQAATAARAAPASGSTTVNGPAATVTGRAKPAASLRIRSRRR